MTSTEQGNDLDSANWCIFPLPLKVSMNCLYEKSSLKETAIQQVNPY